MKTYTNDDLGVALTIEDDGRTELFITRPRQESMLGDDRVHIWADRVYATHMGGLTEGDYSI